MTQTFLTSFICLTILLYNLGIPALVKQEENSIKTVEHWEKKFNRTFNYQYWKEKSTESNSHEYYHMAYIIDALVSMYEATNKRKYLDYSIELTKNVVSKARPVCQMEDLNPKFKYNDCYFGWVNYHYNNREISLDEAYFFRYVTKMLRVVLTNEVLLEDTKLKQESLSLVNFVSNNVWEKWYERDLEEIYRSRTHMASNWAYIALNLSLIDSSNLQYTQVLDNINYKGFPTQSFEGAALRRQIRHGKVTTGFSWKNSTWDSVQVPVTKVQDVSHANNVVAYIVDAYEHDVHWTTKDIEGLKNLFFKVVWNSNKRTFRDCLSGDSCEINKKHIGKFQSDGWMKLGRYDRKIQQIYEDPKVLKQMGAFLNENNYPFECSIYAQLAFNASKLKF